LVDYKESGVDVENAESLVGLLKKKFPALGGYAGEYELEGLKLAAACDGVGTKIKLASMLDMHEVAGEDLVGMNVNDIIASGAKPLFFLDYFSTGRLEKKIFLRILSGIESGLKKADCSLLGGETAEMPGMYEKGEYDLAGFCVGIKQQEYNKRSVKSGDVILALKSSGIHSNGFSLVRKALSLKEIKKYKSMIMIPTRIYSELIPSTANEEALAKIKSMAHVTGGGINRAIKRLLPEGKDARIHVSDPPEIFKIISLKNISMDEMRSVFNMGWGMIFVVSPEDETFVARKLDAERFGLVK